MKTLFLILSFSFCLSYANAQKFVVEKDSLLGMYYVKSEKHDSLLQAYKALGPETDCKTGNRAAYSNYVQRFVCTLLNQDIMDMLTVLVERTNRISDLEKKMDSGFEQLHQENTATQVYLETKINPTLQLLLENQGTVTKHTKDITNIEQRQNDLEDKVDGLGYAVKELQKKMA